MVLKTSPVSCLIAAPVLAVLLLELSPLLNSDKIGGKANTRQMQPALGEHSCIYFLHPRVSSTSRWPLSVRSLCSCLAFAVLPRGWCFVPCQQFSPSLSLHMQDVSFTKQEPASPPTHTLPVCIHSNSMGKLAPTLFVNTDSTQKRSLLFVPSRFPTCCFSRCATK